MGTSALRQHHHIRTAIASVTRSADGATAYVEGIAYPSLDPPASGAIPHAEAALRIDSYVTWMRRATLERFAHQFLRHGRAIDSGHDHREVGELVESYLTGPGHPTYPADVWVTRVMTRDPATIEALDKGELRGFSIEFVSPIAIVPLKIEGESGAAQTVRTGEITDPLPLYLSLVERPSIGVPFEVVEMRGEQPEQTARCREFVQTRSERPAAPELGALGRVTRVVSVASPESAETPENRGAHGEPTTMDKPDTEARATDGATTSQPVQSTTTTAQATSEPAGAVTSAASAEPATAVPEQPTTRSARVTAITATRASLAAAVEKAVTDVRFSGRQKRNAVGLFAEAWAETKDARAMWDAHEFAFCLYDWITCDIRWSGDSDGEKAGDLETASREFAAVVSTIARTFPGYVVDAEPAAAEVIEASAPALMQMSVQGAEGVQSEQPTQARAGKVLSAANREKIQCARDAMSVSMGHIDELLAIGAAVEEAEGEGAGEGEARSAQPTAPTTPVTAATAQPAQPDPVAALEQRLAAVEARTSLDAAALAQARADLDAANARSAEITKAHDEATAARDTARARVAELEGMRPAARSTVDEHEAVLTGAMNGKGTPDTQSDRRSVWAGTLFPAGSTE